MTPHRRGAVAEPVSLPMASRYCTLPSRCRSAVPVMRPARQKGFAGWDVMERRTRASLRPDVGCPDHLSPLLGFIRQKLAEVAGRAWKRRAAPVGKACLHLGIVEAGVDLLIELVDKLDGRASRYAYATHRACLEPRHEVSNGRE